MKSLSIKQVLQILKIASESKRNHAMILLAFQHGMRASEICGLKLDASDFVFTSQKGGRVDRTQFFRIFQAVAERAGIPMDLRHPHCLKHSLGFALVESGAHMATIKQALGHKKHAVHVGLHYGHR